ncbi:glutathione S-transferase family protein [Lysobacter cavernae]|uniref:Glutathione S-transferase family protein n=1 Tax=Lysobacter cavernae TaxID=1685901 RepID=A0ABV7RJQ4_9GAMM
MPPTVSCTLIGESFSPWTQKARWAIEYCGIDYRYIEYTPTLSEPALRWRMRQWSGRVSVPVLLDRQVVRGSWEIARYAAARASDDRLGDFAEAAAWNELSEAALAQARIRVVRCVHDDPQALDEALAGIVPRVLRKPLRFVARDATRCLDRKYAHLVVPGALRRALEATRNGLQAAGGDYLLGRFSYADMAMAVVLETIAPNARTEPPLGPATRCCWSDPALAAEFADLLSWRARLAASHPYSQYDSRTGA